MRFHLQHRTTYAFDAPVHLERHVIRLRPRTDGATRVIDFALDIDPAPVVRSDNLDLEGNLVVVAWFDQQTKQLDIRSEANVETVASDPFGFLVADPERTLPYAYPVEMGEHLRRYRRAPDAADVSVRAVAVEAAETSRREQATYAFALARQIQRDFKLVVRPEGSPLPAAETVSAGEGACRDLAVLFVECCRSMGLAARFVSGYHYAGDAAPPDLHAWGEVYLAGGGWRGYDPSLGLAVTERHVALAAAAEAEDAAAISGTFRGEGVSARLDAELVLRVVAPQAGDA